MIEVSGLTKQFKGVLAVDQVSFQVAAGEIFGLLGENGAGKTTTLRMLATVLEPTAGTATLGGFDLIREAAKVRSRIGVLSGEGGIYNRLTAAENVAYFGKLHGMNAQTITARIDRIFADLDMEEYRNRRAGNFSKGMKQKVAIARSIIHDPAILFFDEPTAGLDVTSARVVQDFLLHCREEGKAIILSSHIMSEVEKLCDRVGVIHRGRIVATGTTEELSQTAKSGSFEDTFVGLVGGEQ